MAINPNLIEACRVTGFVQRHGEVCQEVADRVSCVIMFREPGTSAQGLIAENYSMKGFRIDTKSCNWGPMCGFVCADPRLSKPTATGGSYQQKNVDWTKDAIEGHIHEKWFGKPNAADVADWKANVMPIVISGARIEYLGQPNRAGERIIAANPVSGGGYRGISSKTFNDATGTVVLPWRLMPVSNASLPWLKDERGTSYGSNYFVLCVDNQAKVAFQQLYPAAAGPMKFKGLETILGLINPGTQARGFKACVTADYDLFSIWPSATDNMDPRHKVMGQLSRLGSGIKPSQVAAANNNPPVPGLLPGGVARLPVVDDRMKASGGTEHFRYGDVSGRIMAVKTMLNSAIQGEGRYSGGNAIHHNDECGNLALAKGSLQECLPLIVFFPHLGTYLIDSLADFKELVILAREKEHRVIAKTEWLQQARV